MNLDTDTQDALLRRLARVEGQVRAVQKMITDGRECREVIAQVSAASTALDQVGFKILSVVIVDDVLATGGTAAATIRLVESLGAKVAGLVFLIELPALGGRKLIDDYVVNSVVSY